MEIMARTPKVLIDLYDQIILRICNWEHELMQVLGLTVQQAGLTDVVP